jgi:hypothetical protein
MARLDHDQFLAAAVAALGAEPDPLGKADLVRERGSDPGGFKAAFKRIKKVNGHLIYEGRGSFIQLVNIVDD